MEVGGFVYPEQSIHVYEQEFEDEPGKKSNREVKGLG